MSKMKENKTRIRSGFHIGLTIKVCIYNFMGVFRIGLKTCFRKQRIEFVSFYFIVIQRDCDYQILCIFNRKMLLNIYMLQ